MPKTLSQEVSVGGHRDRSPFYDKCRSRTGSVFVTRRKYDDSRSWT